MDSQLFELKGNLLDIAIEWHNFYKYQVKVDAQKLRSLTGQQDPTIIESRGLYGKRRAIGISKDIPGSLPMRDFPGYFKPNMRFKAGKALSSALAELNRGIPFEPVLEELGIARIDVMDGCAIAWASGFNVGDRYFISVPILLIETGKGQNLPINPELTALTALEYEEAKKLLCV